MSGLKRKREGAAKITPGALAPFTIYKSDTRNVLSKSYELVDSKLVKAASGGVMTAASATVCSVSNLTELADVLAGMGPKNAISWGVPRLETSIEVGAPFRIVPSAREPENREVERPVMLARTREHFAYLEGEPGVFMIDLDDTAPGKPTPKTPEEVAVLLRGAVPELDDVELLIVPSGSACIHDAATGKELRGTTGWRAYAIVDDAATIPQLGQLLFDALWLVGEGYVKVSASGAKLLRAPVDAAVWQPERLDFVGGAQLGEGLVQRRPAPVLVPPVDRRKAKARLDVGKVMPLTEKERFEVERLRAEEMDAVEEEAAERRAARVRRQVDTYVAKVEESEERAVPPAEKAEIGARVRERLERRSETLYVDQLVEVLCGDNWMTISVGEIIADGERYLNCRARDPYDPSPYSSRNARMPCCFKRGWRSFSSILRCPLFADLS